MILLALITAVGFSGAASANDEGFGIGDEGFGLDHGLFLDNGFGFGNEFRHKDRNTIIIIINNRRHHRFFDNGFFDNGFFR